MKRKKDTLMRLLMIFIGSFLCAISLNAYTLPYKLLAGGVSGIAILIQHVANIPIGYLVLLLNIPIFIVGAKMVDKEFVIYSLIGMLLNSAMLVLTAGIAKKLMVHDILLSCIYSGVIGGVGGGIVLRSRASLGGIDILSVIAKRKFGIKISTVSLVINAGVVLVGSFYSRIDIIFYTLLSMYVGSFVVNKVLDGFDRQKMLFIVTDKENEVIEAIMKEIGRGITLLNGSGAFTGQPRRIINCVVTSSQLMKTMNVVKEIDENSFITLVDASEVHGRGFKAPSF